ncbi:MULTISPECIES: hypothetical protein [unclassified Anabaena]|nr:MULTISPECIES: hypothetical protein [unclassified Anabaena]
MLDLSAQHGRNKHPIGNLDKDFPVNRQNLPKYLAAQCPQFLPVR